VVRGTVRALPRRRRHPDDAFPGVEGHHCDSRIGSFRVAEEDRIVLGEEQPKLANAAARADLLQLPVSANRRG